MEYWVDGYNLIHRQGWLKSMSLEQARERLIHDMPALNTAVRIYFDAQKFPAAGVPAPSPSPRVRVLFTSTVSADDAMVEDLRKAPRGAVTLVTDDRELRGRAKQLSAQAVATDKFLEKFRLAVSPLDTPKPTASLPEREKSEKPSGVAKRDVDDWMRYFGFDKEPPPTA